MPTYLHFVRHAQGFHNLSVENQQLPDPELTPFGKEQCAALRKQFPFHDRITHLVASPMRRTLYTCLLSFEPVVARGEKVLALPEIQEVSALPCDVGSEPAALAKEFGPAGQVDLGLVHPGWNVKTPSSPWAPEMHKLEARARAARLALRKLGSEREAANPGVDSHIVAVTHGGFLHFLTQDWDGINPDRGTGWENTEYRSYEFVDAKGEDEDAAIKETHVSWRRRRGSAIGLTETEQRQLQVVVQGRLKEEFEELEKNHLNAASSEDDSA